MALFNFTHKLASIAKTNTGKHAEKLALEYLRSKGLKKISNNYHCRHGEIDIIMQDQQDMVFIEVRYRENYQHGSAIETIDWRKLKKIKIAIEHYIMTNNLGYIPCRIDVIGLQGNLANPKINWIQNIVSDN